MAYVSGIDSSTTATKAVVWDRDGRAVAEGRAEFALTLPRPGWHEQDPEDWWRSRAAAGRGGLEAVDGSDIEALCATHQRETFACGDEQGRAVRPAIVWMDVRATDQVAALGSEAIHRLTGKPPDTAPAVAAAPSAFSPSSATAPAIRSSERCAISAARASSASTATI